MGATRIPLPANRIAELCRRYHVRKLAVFGSVLSADFGPESDVDVMVEFENGHTPGFEFFTLQEELSTLFGRKVDLLTFRSVLESPNYIFRKQALSQVEILYEAA
jgi:uncharacterized protein